MAFSTLTAASQQDPQMPLVLPESWTFWYLMRHGRQAVQATNYENNIRLVASFETAEEFWAVYGHLRRVGDLPTNSDYQVFRTGVKPVWEDPANAQGGKWVIRLRKAVAARLWEHLLLALLGGYFSTLEGVPADEVCGVVLSVRYQEDIIAVWNKSASDEAIKLRLRDAMRTALSLPSSVPFEYKAHDQAMKDHSSYRNTDKFRK